MRKIFFIFCIIFTVSSCTYTDASFKSISKKELMESWAWKIFIFTDEGETLPIVPSQNNFEDSIHEKPTFANDIWKNNLNQRIFLKMNDVAMKEQTDNVIFEQIKIKK